MCWDPTRMMTMMWQSSLSLAGLMAAYTVSMSRGGKLLGVMGIALVNVNHRYLIGHGVDRGTREDIEQIILGRRSIDNVHA
eukprot:scaffold18875_cov72-Skeletonema_dohrnii-CCMP3373.AAC.1